MSDGLGEKLETNAPVVDLPKLVYDAYDMARIDAANETGMHNETSPETCKQ